MQPSYPAAPVTMKRILFILLCLVVARRGLAQVDIEHRRVLAAQTSFGVVHSDESPSAFGYLWFNENNYPWTNTALRVIFAGIFADGELSCFLPGNPHTAIGFGASGGLYLDSIMPYQAGNLVKDQSFYGDRADARVFINQTFPNSAAIPINLRATYRVGGALYRKTSDTKNFDIPNNFLTQSLGTEFRIGGIVPGLTATRGAELYLAADVNYRSGYTGFGPSIGPHFPDHSEYERLTGALSGKLPAGPTTVFGRLAGGWGDKLDQLSAWKLGGNIVGGTTFAYPLHGYYTRELFAADFGLGNLEWRLSRLIGNMTLPAICTAIGQSSNRHRPKPMIGIIILVLAPGLGFADRGKQRCSSVMATGSTPFATAIAAATKLGWRWRRIFSV